MTSALDVRGITVSIDRHVIIDGLDLGVGRAEVVALLGPSGSGKTTLLAAVAGFRRIDAGTIDIDGRSVAGPRLHLPAEQRSVGFVFQSYALWPHLTALETVAFTIRAQGRPRADAQRDALLILEALGIGDLASRLPADLSGGQQQRVGLARALAREASVFLLDEPTAHLDGTTRRAAEVLIAQQQTERGSAAVYATHDPGEALGIADRVALLRAGSVVQVGAPQLVYDEPVDAWAAALTGAAAIVEVFQESGMVHVGDAVVAADGVTHGPATIVICPEWARLGGPARGVVSDVRFRGPHTDVSLDTPIGVVDVRVVGVPVPARGDRVGWRPERVWVLP